ncbi:MAG: DNA mismatch repair endonuclease MutL [Hyphomicrobiales bacterium]|nr:DNA mismatch repair endonuclease MutL [Hyphomicrobiales bacterium]
MPIRLLDPIVIDRIAAGEVIERPAAAVKELVENALDAGARTVEVAIEGGGRGLIRVADDGRGMDEDDLKLSVERHATSKLPDGDLSRISTFGFRGEALPSLASVARLEIRTRAFGAPTGLRLIVEDGVKGAVAPCGQPSGARVEARGLFAATPARLKFLKSDRAEAQAVAEVVRRLALARPDVRFAFSSDLGKGFDWPACGQGEAAEAERLRQALGDDFAANSLRLEAVREGATLSGRIGLPTFSRPNALSQFLFVNGRAVRDKLVASALRAAYLDVLPADRHAVAALFIGCGASEVDVNVHPAKAEVRFRDPGLVRGLIVGAVKQRLAEALHRAASTGGTATVFAMRPPQPPRPPSPSGGWDWRASPATPFLGGPALAQPPGFNPGVGEPQQAAFAAFTPAGFVAAAEPAAGDLAAPLGAARAQVHKTYIVAETADGVVLVDQHAAHERIVYERLKREREGKGVERQALLVPLVVELDPDQAALIESHAAELGALGLALEGFGAGAVVVREVPAAIADGDLRALVRDLAADLQAEDGAISLERRLDRWLGTFACRHSVRAGRALKPEEMNALLREMERTPLAGQCNHGRPTYVELKLADIERLFGRR